MITIINFNKSYKKNNIFENVNLNIVENGYYYFIGKNGSGKTTFFNCLLGFENFNGSIKINTKSAAAVFDSEQLYTHLSIETNIQIFLEGKLNEDQNTFFNDYLPIDRNRKIKSLSLGQRKMVAILIAVMKESKLLILDEISNGLDVENTKKIKILLKKCKERMIILSCGHQLDFHKEILDNILIINNHSISLIEENQDLEEVYENYVSSSNQTTDLPI
ncbi:ATP-binding cassette domain-containing protein [Listeria ivanovii]|uniref:ATP-binding cassette domain-containing protein n=1 Tax=Listeria ivanovii TaxID=1638 RepID=UPI0015E893AA|nr:ATP-binding cassette domain-containing protein [Listeria ivanovii]